MHARLIDSTLREGSQAVVPYLSCDQKAAVIAGLGRIGVEEIELGHAVTELAYGSEPLAELMAIAARTAPGARRAIWCRARAQDIRTAAALGPEVVSFALPISDRHLATRLHKDRSWALDQIGRLVGVAREAGVGYVSIGLEDATRADPGFLAEVSACAQVAGADRLRIPDTVGICSPAQLAQLVRSVKAHFGAQLGVHVHNDFGMATAGAVAALEAGADWADVSVLGLGERAGISRLEEVAAWLSLRAGCHYDLLAARQTAEMLSGWVSRPIGAQDPVIGSGIFTAESGLHVAGLAADPANYEPYPPELVGAKRSLRIGRNSGRAAVAAIVPEAGDELLTMTARVRAEAARRDRALSPEELQALREDCARRPA
ncbi:homocitrate synthase NifV [Propionibacterium cyclohexanicum]|uniref:Homocitrate synthase NifV n=1 Tax=Propionibacterium cyclohexanicum TaxID=64702 RepID=A0A1H9TZJ1_9ACTN|nr:hypothetical protein [Propionibacterium cyclohexanicum]SES02381.1 homocitrate synthase NifV [Propionibacterium cyclohexanicum]